MNELIDWIAALDPASAFLFALPFMVVAAAFLAHFVRSTWADIRESRSRVRGTYTRSSRDHPAWG
jgi:hypothetical protein